MKIGFFSNQIDERGAWQSYLYAKYARTFLGHDTAIYYPATPYDQTVNPKKRRWLRKWLRPWRRESQETLYNQRMADRMMRDGIPVIKIGLDADFGEVKALYHVKSGEVDGFIPRGTRYWVHAVFNAAQPHGDRYLAVSRWLAHRDNNSFVPHIIDVADDQKNLRAELGIPAKAFVFGRFGGFETFDIPWVWTAIKIMIERHANVYFLFANTKMELNHERVISLPTIYDGQTSLEVQKRRFINTSDAMLHARSRGESFGIAVGEFAVCGKPVLTYAKSPEQAHIDMLSHPLCYHNKRDLVRWMEKGVAGGFPTQDGGYYRECTPEKVMALFGERFIG